MQLQSLCPQIRCSQIICLQKGFSRTIAAGFIGTSLLLTTANAAVISSIHPIGMITEAITNNVTAHTVLAPSSASPHDFALRPRDIKAIKEADLVVWIGKDMEVFLEKPLQSVPINKQLDLSQIPEISQLITTQKNDFHEDALEHDIDHHHDEADSHEKHSDHLNEIEGSEHKNEDEHHDHSIDYHLWMSPEIAKIIATKISQKLIEQLPEQQKLIEKNLEEFNLNLQATNSELSSKLKAVSGQKYYVFHDGYGYFESHYGLNNVGHFTVNPTLAPGAKQLAEIKAKLNDNAIKCVFSEPQYSSAVINSMIEGTAVKTAMLDPVGSEIALSSNAYFQFLENLSDQYLSCLK